MTIVVMFPTAPNPDPASMNYTVVVLGGVLVLALVYYYFPAYGGIYWFKGPQSTLEKSASSHESGSNCDEQSSSKKSLEKVKDDNVAEVKAAFEARPS